jgi:hypothetical protein
MDSYISYLVHENAKVDNESMLVLGTMGVASVAVESIAAFRACENGMEFYLANSTQIFPIPIKGSPDQITQVAKVVQEILCDKKQKLRLQNHAVNALLFAPGQEGAEVINRARVDALGNEAVPQLYAAVHDASVEMGTNPF